MKIVRVAIELTLWMLTISLVANLSGCTESAQQAAQQESGTQSECILTATGNTCRSPNGISTPK